MNYKILVVDDEQPIADILKFNLEKEGYQVVVANDGDEAINLAEQEDPDLILLDIMLPNKDGNEVLLEIRKTKNMPIIMLTARAGEQDKIDGLEAGADDYITKPFTSHELVEVARRAFESAELFPDAGLRLGVPEERTPPRSANEGARLVGNSLPMREVLALATKVAPTDSNVLVVS